ncbi:hypothetical protein ACP275_07G047100 [Erythranthe tilingii]
MSKINIFLFVLGFVVLFITTTSGYDPNSVDYETKTRVERPGKPLTAIPPRIIRRPKPVPGGGSRPPSHQNYNANPSGMKKSLVVSSTATDGHGGGDGIGGSSGCTR